MTAEPGKLYLAIMYYWLWPPAAIEKNPSLEQKESRIAKIFDATTANDAKHKTTDLREIAEFAITLANHFQPISPERRIRLEVYEVNNPLAVF
jgi:hypothetical protein